jgi:hypothetical protein
MPYVDEFEPGGTYSDELIGPPDPISSAIGHIVLVYGRLDAYVSAVLIRLLDGDEAWVGCSRRGSHGRRSWRSSTSASASWRPRGPSTPAPPVQPPRGEATSAIGLGRGGRAVRVDLSARRAGGGSAGVLRRARSRHALALAHGRQQTGPSTAVRPTRHQLRIGDRPGASHPLRHGRIRDRDLHAAVCNGRHDVAGEIGQGRGCLDRVRREAQRRLRAHGAHHPSGSMGVMGRVERRRAWSVSGLAWTTAVWGVIFNTTHDEGQTQSGDAATPRR